MAPYTTAKPSSSLADIFAKIAAILTKTVRFFAQRFAVGREIVLIDQMDTTHPSKTWPAPDLAKNTLVESRNPAHQAKQPLSHTLPRGVKVHLQQTRPGSPRHLTPAARRSCGS